jgi:nitronate monooxygenase
MSDPEVYDQRVRLCDVGLLRSLYKKDDQAVGYRCPAEPEDQYLQKGGQPEDLVGRGCLCNNLGASAGFPQHRADGYVEQPLVTSGKGLPTLGQFFRPGQRSYTAKDVIDYLTGKR